MVQRPYRQHLGNLWLAGHSALILMRKGQGWLLEDFVALNQEALAHKLRVRAAAKVDPATRDWVPNLDLLLADVRLRRRRGDVDTEHSPREPFGKVRCVRQGGHRCQHCAPEHDKFQPLVQASSEHRRQCGISYLQTDLAEWGGGASLRAYTHTSTENSAMPMPRMPAAALRRGFGLPRRPTLEPAFQQRIP